MYRIEQYDDITLKLVHYSSGVCPRLVAQSCITMSLLFLFLCIFTINILLDHNPSRLTVCYLLHINIY